MLFLPGDGDAAAVGVRLPQQGHLQLVPELRLVRLTPASIVSLRTSGGGIEERVAPGPGQESEAAQKELHLLV